MLLNQEIKPNLYKIKNIKDFTYKLETNNT